MDEVLQRLLKIEHQAAGLVAEAEKEAERIGQQGRDQVNEQQLRFQRELAVQVQQLIDDRVKQAEQQKHQELAELERQLADWAAALRANVAPAVKQAVAVLAGTADG